HRRRSPVPTEWSMKNLLLLCFTLLALNTAAATTPAKYDVIIRGGTVYDGSGGKPYVGDVAISKDKIAYVGPRATGDARTVIDARGKAVSPGFINMLAHPEESLLVDPRALSDLKQGVTLEVMGELSMGPLTPKMRTQMKEQQIDISYEVDWTTLGGYLAGLEKRGISPNVASFVGAGTVRTNVLDQNDVAPTPAQLSQMKTLVKNAMEEGALGLTTALIYAPHAFAKTDELIALAKESARCGGIYSVHMRSEGDKIEAAIDETIRIARESGAPAEIYHLKFAGRDNWGKIDQSIKTIEAARAKGIRIAANMYNYTAGATGLDASMPPWVQEGGLDAWIARLKDPAIRARVIKEIRDPKPTWENLYLHAGTDGLLFLQFKNEKLKPLTGKTLTEIAKLRGQSPEDTMIDLVIEDNSRVGVAYFLMSEKNVRRQLALPWMTFGSDEGGYAPEGAFLKSNPHPRAYGNFARLLGRYVRDEKLLPMENAIYKLSGLAADHLSIQDRGRLKRGNFADVVVFDPATIQDHATFDKPQQFATGVEQVFVNGIHALKNGEATRLPSGRFVRGRAWTGKPGGGCRASSAAWTWSR
ncbi:MAG: D-aminoacylase, partial [Usitatibacteraceae bacterium]